jgi:predicted DNA-binding transcriptional regulator AlpA
MTLEPGEELRTMADKAWEEEAQWFEPLWSVEQVSSLLGVAVSKMYDWGYDGKGPRWIKVGRYLRCRPSEVRVWLEAREAA